MSKRERPLMILGRMNPDTVTITDYEKAYYARQSMMFPMGETKEHNHIKEIVSQKLREWYGASLTEYPAEGHEDDVFAVSKDRKKILVEVIWTPANFYRDINIVQQSEAEVKVVIANPTILAKATYVREFEKVRISQRKLGFAISDLIDGSLILGESSYADTNLRDIINRLIGSLIGLQIVFDPTNPQLLGEYQYEATNLIRRVARAEIWNHSPEKARTVNAILTVLEGSKRPRPTKLHFAFTPENKSEPEPIEIERGSYKIVDIVFTQPKLMGSTNITRTTGSSFIGTELKLGTQSPILAAQPQVPPSVEVRPFDVQEEGCYIATNDALRWPNAYSQYHLPPGEYTIEVQVNSDNLSSVSNRFNLISPKSSEHLLLQYFTE